MREATMSDLGAARPRKASGKGGTSARASKASSFRSKLRRIRPQAITGIASAGFAAIMVGIVLNAVVFQKGRHPAPLFGSVPAVASAPHPTILPPVRVQAAAPQQNLADPPVSNAAAPSPHPVPASVRPALAPAAKPKDGIAQFLREKPQADPHATASIPRSALIQPGAAKPAVTGKLAETHKPKMRPGQHNPAVKTAAAKPKATPAVPVAN
ncbi:hypothetical protein LGH83_00835 [Lichenihabitans sp. PAMC28606]|uniref:hypothetical protein n=1 Tax=Lichenihabitans sp. PAMC28606 TaxID=2880932 RepID=UPI001D0B82AF|nr:hypothetical protein [Lichenihabitans sp. PAMC28606]UDL94862.1 hypothetical protein LGH83_00835 [Lichenihabitans sp. PAMC28606]